MSEIYADSPISDYIDFLESLKNSISCASDEAFRLIQHAPDDRKNLAHEIGKFLAIYSNAIIQAEIAIMRMRRANELYGFPANDVTQEEKK